MPILGRTVPNRPIVLRAQSAVEEQQEVSYFQLVRISADSRARARARYAGGQQILTRALQALSSETGTVAFDAPAAELSITGGEPEPGMLSRIVIGRATVPALRARLGGRSIAVNPRLQTDTGTLVFTAPAAEMSLFGQQPSLSLASPIQIRTFGNRRARDRYTPTNPVFEFGPPILAPENASLLLEAPAADFSITGAVFEAPTPMVRVVGWATERAGRYRAGVAIVFTAPPEGLAPPVPPDTTIDPFEPSSGGYDPFNPNVGAGTDPFAPTGGGYDPFIPVDT